MLQPYIVECGVRRFVGQSAKMGGITPTGEDIGRLYEKMNEIFGAIPFPTGEIFYGITLNFANGSEFSRKDYWLCKEVATFWEKDAPGVWEELPSDLETLFLPATRWLYLPVRFDDPEILILAPEELRGDPGSIIPYVYQWGKIWLQEHGYQRQDFPVELEIYGLNDGYESVEGGANMILAIPMV